MRSEGRRYLLAIFENERDVLDATAWARDQGHTIVDVHTPYAVHGLETAMGISPTRISLVTLTLGLVGAALKIWFEYWTTAIDWPINVGGKPWDSFPAFFPVTFEVMVLSAGLGTVIALLVTRKLVPGRKARLPAPGITDDRFVLVLEERDAAFDKVATTRVFERFHAIEVVERVEEELSR